MMIAVRQLGPHAIKSSSSAQNWARHANVVKALDRIEILRQARKDAIKIHRHFYRPQSLDRNPTDVAHELLHSLQGYNDPLLFLEVGYNEIGKQDTDKHLRIIKGVNAIVQPLGYRTCGPNWGTGDYEGDTWNLMREEKWGGCNAVALHAYWGNEGFTPWNALRYRTYYDPRIDPPLLLITECGRDKVEGGNGGWHLDHISAETYLSELAEFDAYLHSDSCVYGTVFTAGPTWDWRDFSTDDISNRIQTISQAAPILPGGSMSKFVLGFKELADLMQAQGLDPGTPLENEVPRQFDDGFQVTRQRTTTGVMLWVKEINAPLFVGKDRRVAAYDGTHLLVTERPK